MTKGVHKRIKVTLACTTCRRKKVKCDGVQPACSRCESTGIQCFYTISYKKRGPSKIQFETIKNRMHRIKALFQSQKTAYSTQEVNRVHQMPVNILFYLIAEAVEQKKIYDSNVSFSFIENLPNHAYSTWIEHFFSHFHVLYPVISQDELKEQNDPLSSVCIFALGALYSSFKCHGVLFEKAEFILHTLTTQYTLSTVKALILMCWYCHLTGDVQKCDLYRHQLSKAIEWLIQDTTMETKNRIYWIAWVMDQWIASCTQGKRKIIEWQCEWPQSEKPFHEIIRISVILQNIHQEKQPFHIIEADLTAWLLNLPSCATSLMTRLYRTLYYTAQILLNQRYQHPSSSSTCITAANSILFIAKQIVNLGHVAFAYNTFFLSLTLATSFIYLNPATCLFNSIYLLKQTSCCLLTQDELGQLLCCYLSPLSAIDNVEQMLSISCLLDLGLFTAFPPFCYSTNTSCSVEEL